MKYQNTFAAKFISRPNRFIATVELNEKTETVHVKNTGRCRELLLPGSEVILAGADNPARKTKYDLIAVKKSGLGWVNIDSGAPNQLVREWLEEGAAPFRDITLIRPEYGYGRSRVDFYMEAPGRKILLEVKGCTLEIDGTGYFPDAPTQRGVKHLQELAAAVREGYDCCIAFVITMPRVRTVLPNTAAHPAFEAALKDAVKAGVSVLYLSCDVGPDSLSIKECTKAAL